MNRKFLPLYIISVFNCSIFFCVQEKLFSYSMLQYLQNSESYPDSQVLPSLNFSDKNLDESVAKYFYTPAVCSQQDTHVSLLTLKIEEYKNNQSSIEKNNVTQEKIEKNIDIITKNDCNKNKKIFYLI